MTGVGGGAAGEPAVVGVKSSHAAPINATARIPTNQSHAVDMRRFFIFAAKLTLRPDLNDRAAL